MTKGELRAARKAARAQGRPLTGPLALDPLDDDRGPDPVSFSETRRGHRALERWARYHDALNGRPESDYDR